MGAALIVAELDERGAFVERFDHGSGLATREIFRRPSASSATTSSTDGRLFFTFFLPVVTAPNRSQTGNFLAHSHQPQKPFESKSFP
jgi:hypothetical protein